MRNSLAALALCAASLSAAAERLTLDQALSLALDSNRTYRITLLEARTAADAVSWGEAGFLPKVDATASYTRSKSDTRQVRAGTPPDEKTGAESSSKLAGVTGTWTVFEGLTSLAAYKRLAATAEIYGARSEEARQALAAAVILAYGGAVRERTVLAALDSAVSLSRERVKITQGKYGFGGVSKLELLQAQLDLNADLAARLRQALALADAKRLLNRLLARPDSAAVETEDTIPLAAASDAAALRERALRSSPAVRQAALGRSLADAAYREYVGRLFPAVGLSLGYNYSLTEAEAGLIRENEALGLTYGINVRMNLFDGFSLRDDWRAARRARERADLNLAEARSGLSSELAEAEMAWRASLESLDLETANVALARENMGIAMERLRLGTIASLELRAAQEKFVAAETRLVSARLESKRSETELLRLAGALAPR